MVHHRRHLLGQLGLLVSRCQADDVILNPGDMRYGDGLCGKCREIVASAADGTFTEPTWKQAARVNTESPVAESN